MNQENLSKLDRYLRSQGVEAALLSNPANVTWLTGYASFIQTGPSPFEGGPALGWYRAGELALLVNDWEAGAAGATGAQVHNYVGFTVDKPLKGIERQAEALGEMLKEHASLKGKVAVEMDFLPAALLAPLQESLPGATLEHLERQLTPLRAVKTSEEIQKIRAALRMSDVAQEEIQRHIRVGASELDLWQAVRSRVEREAGGRLPVLADLVAGVKTADIGGLPGTYVLQSGDPVMLDFVSRLDGYWGDNSAGYFVGDPSAEMSKAQDIVLEALHRGQEAIRPGLRADVLDGLVRSVIRDAGYEPYPHHSGHGLGTTYHEEPRIVPNHDMSLQPGMVMVLEPGIYLPGVGGIRFEDAYLVTEDGCEVLTQHLKGK
jgi:Xaa-Pro dipeptidase